jgi:hypothetical protein
MLFVFVLINAPPAATIDLLGLTLDLNLLGLALDLLGFKLKLLGLDLLGLDLLGFKLKLLKLKLDLLDFKLDLTLILLELLLDICFNFDNNSLDMYPPNVFICSDNGNFDNLINNGFDSIFFLLFINISFLEICSASDSVINCLAGNL